MLSTRAPLARPHHPLHAPGAAAWRRVDDRLPGAHQFDL